MSRYRTSRQWAIPPMMHDCDACRQAQLDSFVAHFQLLAHSIPVGQYPKARVTVTVLVEEAKVGDEDSHFVDEPDLPKTAT